jgi:nitrous oxidase accessory protein NosD
MGALAFREQKPARVQVITVNAPGTIGAALAKANPGDTVVVTPGIYAEPVRLANGVSIIAQPAHEAVIQGGVTAEGVTNSRLEGFGVHGPVRIVNSDVVLAFDDVSGADEAGIEFSGNSRGAVAGSSVHNNTGPGILVKDAATPAIEHNAIWGNGLTDPRALRPGIAVQGEAHPRIDSNVFGSNGAEPIWIPKADDTLALRNYFNSGPGDNRPRVRVTKSAEGVRAPR